MLSTSLISLGYAITARLPPTGMVSVIVVPSSAGIKLWVNSRISLDAVGALFKSSVV